jgi:hypothetical protein
VQTAGAHLATLALSPVDVEKLGNAEIEFLLGIVYNTKSFSMKTASTVFALSREVIKNITYLEMNLLYRSAVKLESTFYEEFVTKWED